MIVPWRFTSQFENYEGGWPFKIAKELGPGKVFIDVGAFVGAYTVPAGKSGAKVLAVEPSPFNFSLLKEVVERNGIADNVHLVNCAISDRKGTIKLRGAKGLDVRFGPYRSDFEVELEVPCATLDELTRQLKLKSIEWIKIDAQGNEDRVLEGAGEILKKFKPKILVEVCEVNAEKIKRLFRQLGYTVRPVHYVGLEVGLGLEWNWLSIPSGGSNRSQARPE